MSNTIQSVERALTLLELTVDRASGIGVRELARASELKAPTAQQLLKTLQARGYLYFDPDTRQYQAGRALAKLCAKVDPMTALRDALRSPVQEFHGKHGETTIVQTMVDGEARILLEFSANHPLTVRHGDNVIDDPHLWASGSVVLAWQSDAFLAHYAQAHDWDSATLKSYRAQLAKIRKSGLAEMVDVASSGVAALGAPVIDRQGEFVCALGCSVPLNRWDNQQRKNLIHEIKSLAEQLGSTL